MRWFERLAWGGAAAVATLALDTGITAAGVRRLELTIGPAPFAHSTLLLGVTHSAHSADPWGVEGAVARARAVLRQTTQVQNQHLMGFGTLNPEPSPEIYDWTSLDRRMALITETGGRPVLTLCCAPDWMKGGVAGRTDWSLFEVAPVPEHFKHFAALAATAARRYPAVQDFQVWNEMKGFWNTARNRWDYEGYTNFYNMVYDAIKAVNPSARIGGPYVVLALARAGLPRSGEIKGAYGAVDPRSLDAIRYWIAHAHGADFVTLDTGSSDAAAGGDPFARLALYEDAARWLRQYTKWPLWWAEWYVEAPGMTMALRNALFADGLIRMAPLADAELRWAPQSDDPQQSSVSSGLWSDTRRAEGGLASPLAVTSAQFIHAFPPGTPLLPVHGVDGSVAALASPADVMLVNRTATAVHLSLDGQAITLSGYAVRVVPRQAPAQRSPAFQEQPTK